MDYYNDKHFIMEDGTADITANVEIMTKICRGYGLELNNKFQIIKGFALYPSDVFCPKSFKTGKIYKTDNTIAIHHFAGSWLNEDRIKLKRLRNRLCRQYGDRLGDFIYKYLYAPYRFYAHAEVYGVKKTINGEFKK